MSSAPSVVNFPFSFLLFDLLYSLITSQTVSLRNFALSASLPYRFSGLFVFDWRQLTLNCKLSSVDFLPMHWFERRIRRYEHRRWTTDDNRRVHPFDWGLEHIGGDPSDPQPAAYVREYAKQAIENSAKWFETTPATDYALDSENVLTFTSSIQSPWPENNTVCAQFFPSRRSSTGTPACAPANSTEHSKPGCPFSQEAFVDAIVEFTVADDQVCTVSVCNHQFTQMNLLLVHQCH